MYSTYVHVFSEGLDKVAYALSLTWVRMFVWAPEARCTSSHGMRESCQQKKMHPGLPRAPQQSMYPSYALIQSMAWTSQFLHLIETTARFLWGMYLLLDPKPQIPKPKGREASMRIIADSTALPHPYLEGQGDLVSSLITPITHIVTSNPSSPRY